jgi:hypothetical protein
VIYWNDIPDNTISADRLREILTQEVRQFLTSDATPDGIMGMQVQGRSLNTFDPNIRTSIYPTAFYCLRCGHIEASEPERERQIPRDRLLDLSRRMGRGRRCPDPGCGGLMGQWNLLTVHICGEEIHLPTHRTIECRDHGSQHLHFDRHGSERTQDWYFRCAVDGCNNEPVNWPLHMNHGRDACNVLRVLGQQGVPLDDYGTYSTSPIQKFTNFVPRVVNVLHAENEQLMPRRGSREAIALSLGVASAEQVFDDFNPRGGLNGFVQSYVDPTGAAQIQERLRVIQGMDLPENIREQLMREFDGNEELGISGTMVDVFDNVGDSFRKYIYQAFAFAEMTRHDRSTSIEDLLELGELPPISQESLERAARLAEALSITHLFHVSDIPLSSCLVGYTRGDYDPRRLQLKLYIRNTNRGPFAIVYTRTVQTEGVLFRLDPSRVLIWLANRHDEPDIRSRGFSDDLLDLQNRFQYESFEAFGSITDDWTSSHYSLLHTASHIMLKSIAKYSGLEQESLGELVLPYQNAFLVYANQNTPFVLGGLEMAFEHTLDRVLLDGYELSQSCSYNPECEETWGACHGCIHMAEITCEMFNRQLDRRVINPASEGGFWPPGV